MGLLLRLLSEGDARARREVVKTLGITGALDPHTHKCNQANLQGEGRLESEGVRAQRNNSSSAAPGAAGNAAHTLGALPGDDFAGDLLQVGNRLLLAGFPFRLPGFGSKRSLARRQAVDPKPTKPSRQPPGRVFGALVTVCLLVISLSACSTAGALTVSCLGASGPGAGDEQRGVLPDCGNQRPHADPPGPLNGLAPSSGKTPRVSAARCIHRAPPSQIAEFASGRRLYGASCTSSSPSA